MTATGEIWVPVDKQEFREFLKCGVLAHGFTRLRCADCAFERLVPFSCKRRGFCPSCGGRRMAEHAASLVDEVLPRVPVRQWVLTLPYRLRYRLAWDHALCRAVLGVYVRTLLAFYARTARSHGIQGGRTGTVTAIQRFGSGLQLNVHFHSSYWTASSVKLGPGRSPFTPRPHRATPTWHTSSPSSAPGSGGCSPAATSSRATTPPRRTRWPKPRLCWPASSQPPSRAGLPSAPAPVPASAASATSRTSVTSPPAARGRPSSTASTSTLTSGFPPTIALVWNTSVVISSAPRSHRTVSAAAPTGASSSNSRQCGAMEHRTSSSSPSNS